jgi:hypothetical protein
MVLYAQHHWIGEAEAGNAGGDSDREIEDELVPIK